MTEGSEWTFARVRSRDTLQHASLIADTAHTHCSLPAGGGARHVGFLFAEGLKVLGHLLPVGNEGPGLSLWRDEKSW